eukprot:c30790_g1_i1 orf=25-177(+)
MNARVGLAVDATNRSELATSVAGYRQRGVAGIEQYLLKPWETKLVYRTAS